MGKMTYRVLAEPEGKKVLERMWHKWEKSTEMHFNELETESMKWLYLAQISLYQHSNKQSVSLLGE
jgi:hypothetical protein